MFETFKIRAALLKHQRGQIEEAKQVYAQMYEKGIIQCSYLLPWSIVLLREGGEENYKKVKELLTKAQKASDMTPAHRNDLLLNFSVADFKLGAIDKAIDLLERVHQKSPSGSTYGALGYMYIEQGDAEKALEFNQKALEYDDEDPVTLDNLGQIYYRLLNDKEKALEYFTKAHEIKATQIDTLWFLSRYDIEQSKTEDAIEKLETAAEGRFSPLNYITKADVEAELKRLRG